MRGEPRLARPERITPIAPIVPIPPIVPVMPVVPIPPFVVALAISPLGQKGLRSRRLSLGQISRLNFGFESLLNRKGAVDDRALAGYGSVG